jgi:hypothetical protein
VELVLPLEVAMILQANKVAQRFSRVFSKPTELFIQVRNANTVQIGHDISEASGVTDGIQLTQTNTSTNYPPFRIIWRGELWFSASADATQFSIVVGDQTS